MQKPIDAVEKEFNQNGIFFLPNPSIEHPSFEGRYVGVDVEIVVMTDVDVTAPDFSVSIINRREVALFATDWKFFERDGQKLLGFSVYQRMPDTVVTAPGQVYMSFLDLCFYAGNESIPEVYGDDILTKPRAGVPAADIGWVLPSRFADALIDALGKLDHTMLGGNVQQALLYGPVFLVK